MWCKTMYAPWKGKSINKLWIFPALALLIGTKYFLNNETKKDLKVWAESLHNWPGEQNPKLCPAIPPFLLGNLSVKKYMTLDEAEVQEMARVRSGGRWWPEECEARWRVAILVPYRDRERQVGAFLGHLHPFLQRQQLNYSIYLVEQQGKDPFNRGALLNVGFLEAQKEGPWDCYTFHDVDMLPENDHHLYHCTPQPLHLAVAPSTTNYRIPYDSYFGGVSLMMEAHVRLVNGWSNLYWGWGAEDDDMWIRIKSKGLAVWRHPIDVARYTMIQHKESPRNERRFSLLEHSKERFQVDGLNSVNYTVTKTPHLLYTHLLTQLAYVREVTKTKQEKLYADTGDNRTQALATS